MSHTTNIIDKPRLAGARDLLGTDKYMEALIKFMSNANLPTTVAIQGEWGSGKTSMMNQIRHKLCERDDASENEFYGIWINTWQYSLMNSPNETIVKVISGLTKEILSIVSKKHETSTAQLTKKVGNILSLVAKSAAKTAISATGLDGGGLVDDILSKESGEANILELRDALQEAVNKCLEEDKKAGKPKKGFLFFIDDLDRIDPPVAVEILEIVKNIFEVENCLFILAIDYEVVVKGLEPKFGKLTEKNEREFRSFFDKIIQLPFSMPLGSYSIDQFLIESLHDVRYIDEVLLKDDEFQTLISEMATESVGTNPRGIKRLINTLSLIQIMNELEEGDFGESRQDKLLNFGLVCIQIAYPSIYDLISEEPNFISWDEKLANKLRLKALSAEQVEMLDDTEEFDEDWEKVVFRACINDAFLSGRAFNVSGLLNLIKGLVPKGANFEEEIQKILTLSAVTSVNMEKSDKPPKFSKVRMSGIGAYLTNLKSKGTAPEICETFEEIYNRVNKSKGDRITWQFTPNMVTIQAANSKLRSKTITGLIPRKKNLKMTWLHRFGADDKNITLNSKGDFTEEMEGYIYKGLEVFEEGKEVEW
jgi:hypothetical protein